MPVLDLGVADMKNMQITAVAAEIQLERDSGPEHRIVDASVRYLKIGRPDRHARHRHHQFLPVGMAEPAGISLAEQAQAVALAEEASAPLLDRGLEQTSEMQSSP